jgi:hypothetical protein
LKVKARREEDIKTTLESIKEEEDMKALKRKHRKRNEEQQSINERDNMKAINLNYKNIK